MHDMQVNNLIKKDNQGKKKKTNRDLVSRCIIKPQMAIQIKDCLAYCTVRQISGYDSVSGHGILSTQAP